MLCVMSRMVVGLVVWIFNSRLCICSCVSVLSVLNGLFSSRILGLWVSVLVRDVCCVMLLEILWGCWLVVCLRFISCRSLWICLCFVWCVVEWGRLSLMFWVSVCYGSSCGFWKVIVVCLLMLVIVVLLRWMCLLVGVLRLLMRWRSVDFLQLEGLMMVMIFFVVMLRFILCSILWWFCVIGNDCLMLLSCMV